jgi:hypothetical protein
MSMLDSALFYAERGWHVFPCGAGLKKPATEHGWKDATTDADKIRAWWNENPDYNVAIATGPSGLFVVDIDPGAEVDWTHFVAAHPDIALALTDTYAVRTPRGGWHYYFEGEGRSSASKLLAHVDTRGVGGYVLAPPSRVNTSKAQGVYTLYEDRALQPIPPSIASRMAVPDREQLPDLPPEGIEWDAPETIVRVTAWLEGLVGAGEVAIEGCGGENRTFDTICKVLERGITPATAYELLTEIWNPHCLPPWDTEELEAKIISAWRNGQDTRGGKAEPPLEIQHQHLMEYVPGLFADVPEEYRYLIPYPITELRKNKEPLRWLIKDFLPEVGMGYLYGPSGTFKTFLALDLALSVATGHGPNWWQDGDREPQPVVYLVGESPHGFRNGRTDAWLHARGIPGLHDLASHLIVVETVPPIQYKDHWRELVKMIKMRLDAMGFKRPALFVIDTLSRLMEGLSISDQQHSSQAAGTIERMAKALECCVLLVHHVGKDEQKGMVGSYVWYANADTVVEITRESAANKNVVLQTRKQKEADPGPPMRYLCAPYGESIAFERDWKAQFDESREGRPTVLSGPGSEEWSQPEAIIEVLREGPMSTEHLADSLSVRWRVERRTIIKTLKKLSQSRYKAWQLSKDIWSIPTPSETPPDIDVSVF